MRHLYIFLIFFNNVLRLTPPPASKLTPREAKGKCLDTRFSLFKPRFQHLTKATANDQQQHTTTASTHFRLNLQRTKTCKT
ncbi:hypothetical protein Hanom_Chr01g00016641 [Helianthus anomalus]